MYMYLHVHVRVYINVHGAADLGNEFKKVVLHVHCCNDVRNEFGSQPRSIRTSFKSLNW